jgi:hypothetical protein
MEMHGTLSAVKQRQKTLDGGPASDDKIVLAVEIIDPAQAIFGSNRLHLAAAKATYERVRQPTPLFCSACVYGFEPDEEPPLIFCTRPFFPKAESYRFICGAICPRCAAKPNDELMQDVTGYLRGVKPDTMIIQVGQA